MIAFICIYCGGAHRRENQRHAWECASCSAPCPAPDEPFVAEICQPPTRLGRFHYHNGGIIEIDEILRTEWLEHHAVVNVLRLSAQDFVDVAQLILCNVRTHPDAPPAFRTPVELDKWANISDGEICGWYFSKYAPAGSQLVRVLLKPKTQWPDFEAAVLA